MTSRPSTDPDSGQTATLRAEADAILRRLVGRPDATWREDQWTAVEALVAGRRRALVVQRTGWGKSAVYFVATALLRVRGAGPTVIVSPLLALMRNQVDAARAAGIAAETINSANVTEWDAIRERVAAGEIDVLLVSPERLNNPGFRDEVLPRLSAEAGLVVVDEAHCISDWGHDFRPDYRRIKDLLAELPAHTPVLATTATANARVTADVAEQLSHHGDTHEDVLVLRGPLDRRSLRLTAIPPTDHVGRLAWLGANLDRLPGSGIVYCLTVAAAEQVAAHLKETGVAAAAYTGRTEPTERLALEQDLLENRVKALVATSALGMGFDKPDLGFVVHLGAPASPIAYYQQVGRAGRATSRAEVVLVPGTDDAAIWDWFGSMAFPAEPQVRATLDVLSAAGRPMSTAALEPRVDLRRARLETMLKVLDVDGAVRRVQGGWTATGEPWSYDAERYERVAEARLAEQRAMLEYARTDGCRMAFLRRALDDPELADDPAWVCGRCDNCARRPGTVTGTAAVGTEPHGARSHAAASGGSETGVGSSGTTPFVTPDDAALADARERLGRAGTDVEPRKLWPTGMAALGIALTGRIPAGEAAAAGRAVARLDGLGLGGVLRDLFAGDPGDPDDRRPESTTQGPAPIELPPLLRLAVVSVLDAWRPGVDGVVLIPSTTRPGLVEHLATGIARHLGVPVVGTVRAQGPAGRHDINSAQRLAGVVRRLRLDLSPEAIAGLPGKRVLLVDDRMDSGWTLTVAARELRLAGAAEVLPFVLGVG